jgi:ribosomal protein L11
LEYAVQNNLDRDSDDKDGNSVDATSDATNSHNDNNVIGNISQSLVSIAEIEMEDLTQGTLESIESMIA